MKKILLLFLVSMLIFSAGAREVLAVNQTYRYIKWEVTKRKSTTDECAGTHCIQAAEFVLLLNGSNVSWPSGTSASNPGGNNPSGETAAQAIDSNLSTKWLDRNFNSDGGDSQTGSAVLLIDTGSGNSVTFNGYKWATANDATPRDPVSWRLSGSNNNSDWTLIDQQSDIPVTDSRNTYISSITFVAAAPEFSDISFLLSLLLGSWMIVHFRKTQQHSTHV